MDFNTFKNKVEALCLKTKGEIGAVFSTDEEIGKHFAYCNDGTIITANTGNLKVTVRWGNGHQSMAAI